MTKFTLAELMVACFTGALTITAVVMLIQFDNVEKPTPPAVKSEPVVSPSDTVTGTDDSTSKINSSTASGKKDEQSLQGTRQHETADKVETDPADAAVSAETTGNEPANDR